MMSGEIQMITLLCVILTFLIFVFIISAYYQVKVEDMYE